MNLPVPLSQASRQGRLLALWGALPFPLAERPPANRALVISQWAAQAQPMPPLEMPVSELPPLPILSLDPSGRLEEAFARAGLPLQVVLSRHAAPGRGGHVLFKLAGDLATRSGLILSRAEVGALRGDPDKAYVLDETRRRARGGAILWLGSDPANDDFQAWWAILASALGARAIYALGDPAAGWPEGVVALGTDFAALNVGLWAAQPEPRAPEPEAAPGAPDSQAGKYVINFYGPVHGPTIGDRARVEQHFEAPAQTVRGDWEALVGQVLARLDDVAAQVDRGVADLKRGQAALYRHVDQAYRDDLARVLAAVQLGRVDQIEMRNTLATLHQAMQAVLREGLPMDPELRTAVADLHQAVDSHLGLERKLELALPLLPLLTYKIELGVGSELDLHALWDELRARWRHLVERFGRAE